MVKRYVLENGIVCHGFGAINGFTITNSREALIQSYKEGKRFFETDINMTSDGKVVLSHGWDCHEYGFRYIDYSYEGVPSYREFKKMKVGIDLETMDFYDFANWLAKHEDAFAFLDINESDYKIAVLIATEINKVSLELNIEHRIVMSGRNWDIVQAFRDVGDWKYLHILYSKELLENTGNSIDRFIEYCLINGIRSVSINVEDYCLEIVNLFKSNGLKIFVFMVETSYDAYKYIKSGVDFLISDTMDITTYNEIINKGALGIRAIRKKGKILVEWNEVEQTRFYSLYRINLLSGQEECVWETIESTMYYDQNIDTEVLYKYYVVAHLSTNKSIKSACCTMMILTKVKKLKVEDGILSWIDNNMASGYTIKCKYENETDYELVKTILSPCKKYEIKKDPDKKMQYKVQAFWVYDDVRIYSGYCKPITIS